MNIGHLKLEDFGNTILLAGGVFSDQYNHLHVILLPGVDPDMESMITPSHEEWKEIIKKTDLKIVEVTQGEKVARALVRKCERSIDKRVSWKVFKRDNYTCRYCGSDDTPLTVDHLVLWEEGGPSIEENLVAACSKCNKMRGNMLLVEWLESDAYRDRSKDLSLEAKLRNVEVATTLDSIPRKQVVRKR